MRYHVRLGPCALCRSTTMAGFGADRYPEVRAECEAPVTSQSCWYIMLLRARAQAAHHFASRNIRTACLRTACQCVRSSPSHLQWRRRSPLAPPLISDDVVACAVLLLPARPLTPLQPHYPGRCERNPAQGRRLSGWLRTTIVVDSSFAFRSLRSTQCQHVLFEGSLVSSPHVNVTFT